MKSFKFIKANIFYVLLLGLLFRLTLSFFGTLELDFNTFLAWSHRLVEVGPRSFYLAWSDYLPGYLYTLWFLGKINILPSLQVVVYKLPAILADLGSGYLIYKIVKEIKNERLALITSCLYIFNPAIFANSTLWGQVDSIPSFFGLLTIYLVNRSLPLSAIFLALGTAIKPQMALVALVVLFIFFRDKWKTIRAFTYVLISFVVFCGLFLPFTTLANLPNFIVERILTTLNQYPYTSVNAFSFWGLFGFWQKDVGRIPPSVIGYALTILFSVIASLKLLKVKHGEYPLLAVTYLAGYIFFTRMHERHLLAALAPVVISSSLWGEIVFAYGILSLTYVANLYYSYVWITDNFKTVFSPGLIKFAILANIASLGYTIFIIVKGKIKKVTIIERFLKKLENMSLSPESTMIKFPKIALSKSGARKWLWVIIIFAFVTRVGWLASPKSEYFDEVYHAFTAKLILHSDPKAWEWWNPNPEGFAYEWTHPPLAKLGMALGMKIFGETPLGWRFPGAILGAVSVFLIYKIAKELFNDEPLALMSAAFFSLDGLTLTMSRIGMNDMYLLTFVLASIYFFLKKKDFASAVMFGLAISSKWSAAWAVPVFGILFLVIRKKFSPSLIWFFIIPPVVYILSYFQMFLTGHNFEIFVGVQKQMWWYHTNLVATHPYTSSWWSWPLDVRPVYLYTSDEVGGWVARIYNLGNPIVFWFGLLSVATSLIYSFLEKNKKLAAIVFSYMVFFVPWAASPRIMFFYHYLPSLPFLAIAAGYVLRRSTRRLRIGIFVASLLVFIYFYPHWAGIQIPLWLDKSYYWFSSWR